MVVALAVLTAVACAAAVLGLRQLGAGRRSSAGQSSAGHPSVIGTKGRPRPGSPGTATAVTTTGVPPVTATGACGGARVGVATDNLSQFEASTRIYPSVAVKYVDWGSPFPASAILANHGIGVTTQVVLKPQNTALQDIADGRADGFLVSWATTDRRLDLPVILSFAPEANGNWYPMAHGSSNGCGR